MKAQTNRTSRTLQERKCESVFSYIEGCFVISTSDIQRAVTVRGGNQLLDCIIQCTGYLYIGLQVQFTQNKTKTITVHIKHLRHIPRSHKIHEKHSYITQSTPETFIDHTK